MAIKLLEGAAQRAELESASRITLEHIRTIRSTIVLSRFDPSSLDEFQDQELAFFLGVVRRLKKEPTVNSGQARRLYEQVCEEFGLEPRSVTQIRKYLSHLEAHHLLEVEMSQSVAGRTKLISPQLPCGELQVILEQRLG